jgi:hypothetical protein
MRINVASRAERENEQAENCNCWGGVAVITLEDCIALCGLSEEEVLAIAEHEHIPEIVAAELGNNLLSSDTGVVRICSMIRDGIVTAHAKGKYRHAAYLERTLTSFQARIGEGA